MGQSDCDIFTGKFVCIKFTLSSCNASISLSLMLIGRGDGLNSLCHSCDFDCQQSVLKRFPGPANLCSENGVVKLMQLLVNLHI